MFTNEQLKILNEITKYFDWVFTTEDMELMYTVYKNMQTFSARDLTVTYLMAELTLYERCSL